MPASIYRHRGLLVLADDDGDLHALVSAALAEVAPDIQFAAVFNGHELLGLLRSKVADESGAGRFIPTVVLLDVQMPVQGGLEALKELRADPILRRIPMLAFTVSESRAASNRMYDAGINAFLVKPQGYDMLCAQLSGLVAFWFNVAHIAG